MPHPLSPLPSPIAGRVFSLTEARALAVPAGRLRRSDIERIGPRLYRPAGAVASELAVAAALRMEHPQAVVSRFSAARIWELPLPLEHVSAGSAPLDLTVPPELDGPRAAGFRVRSVPLPPEDTVLVRGARVTTRARTWWDLMTWLGETELIQMGDHLVRIPRPWAEDGRVRPWATLDELSQLVVRSGGRAGVSRARSVLSQVRVGADSPKETELRLLLLAAGLPEAQLNAPVLGDDGRKLSEPDFQWPQWKVAAEYEGPGHRTPEQIRRDIDRAERMRRAGWIEIRIMAAHMRHGAVEAIRRIRGALGERGWRP